MDPWFTTDSCSPDIIGTDAHCFHEVGEVSRRDSILNFLPALQHIVVFKMFSRSFRNPCSTSSWTLRQLCSFAMINVDNVRLSIISWYVLIYFYPYTWGRSPGFLLQASKVTSSTSRWSISLKTSFNASTCMLQHETSNSCSCRFLILQFMLFSMFCHFYKCLRQDDWHEFKEHQAEDRNQ